jgi:hypothetical protein
MSRDSSIDIVPTLEARQPNNWGSRQGKDFFYSWLRPNSFSGPLSGLPSKTGALSLCVKRPEYEADHSPASSVRLRMCEPVPPPLNTSSGQDCLFLTASRPALGHIPWITRAPSLRVKRSCILCSRHAEQHPGSWQSGNVSNVVTFLRGTRVDRFNCFLVAPAWTVTWILL